MKKGRHSLLVIMLVLLSLFIVAGCHMVQPDAGKEASFRGGRMEFAYAESKWQVSQTPRPTGGVLVILHNQDNDALVTMIAYERISAKETDLFRAIRERDADLELKEEITDKKTESGVRIHTLSYQVDEPEQTRYTYAQINRYSNAQNIAVWAQYYNERDLSGIRDVLATLNTSRSAKIKDIPETLEKDRELGAVLDTFLYTSNGELERKIQEAYENADLNFYPESGYEYIYKVEMVSPLGNIHKILSLGDSYYYSGDSLYYYDSGIYFYAWMEADEETLPTAAGLVKSKIDSAEEHYIANPEDYKNVVVRPIQESKDVVWQVIQVDEIYAESEHVDTVTTIYYAKKITEQEVFAWELELSPYDFDTTTGIILEEISGAYDVSLEEYTPTAEMLDRSNRPAAYPDYGYEYDGTSEIVEEVEGYSYIGKTKVTDEGQEAQIYVPRGTYTYHWDYTVGFDIYGVEGYAYLDSGDGDSTYSEYAYNTALSNAEYYQEYSAYYEDVSDVIQQVYEEEKVAVAYFMEDSMGYDGLSYPNWQIIICQGLAEDNFVVITMELDSSDISLETWQVLEEYGSLLGIDFGFVTTTVSSDAEPALLAEYPEAL